MRSDPRTVHGGLIVQPHLKTNSLGGIYLCRITYTSGPSSRQAMRCDGQTDAAGLMLDKCAKYRTVIDDARVATTVSVSLFRKSRDDVYRIGNPKA
jgi:hypothetical protein